MVKEKCILFFRLEHEDWVVKGGGGEHAGQSQSMLLGRVGKVIVKVEICTQTSDHLSSNWLSLHCLNETMCR